MVDEQHGQEEGGRRSPAGVGAEDQGGPATRDETRGDRESDDTVSNPGGLSPSGEDEDTPERPA